MMQAGSKTLLPEIHKLINSILNKEELSEQWKDSIQSSKGGKNQTVIIIVECHCHFIKYPSIMGFDVNKQLLIKFSAFIRYWRKSGSTL
jgi:hypothetical protein